MRLQLHWQILIALILAIIYGLLFEGEAIRYVSWMGDIFLRMLKNGAFFIVSFFFQTSLYIHGNLLLEMESY